MVPRSDGRSFGVMSGGADSKVEYLEAMLGLVWLALVWLALVWLALVWLALVWLALVWLALVWLAPRSTRVRIGTATCSSLSQPAVVAKRIADVDRATGGRATLGVPVGGKCPSELKAGGGMVVLQMGNSARELRFVRIVPIMTGVRAPESGAVDEWCPSSEG